MRRTTRLDKIKWLMANQHLWSSPTDCALEMIKAELYSSNTYIRDITGGLPALMEDARDCIADPSALARFLPPADRPTERAVTAAKEALGTVRGGKGTGVRGGQKERAKGG